ncbi:hypothetical protein [Halomontanus rarus]
MTLSRPEGGLRRETVAAAADDAGAIAERGMVLEGELVDFDERGV